MADLNPKGPRSAFALVAGVTALLLSFPALARGPDSVADVAAPLLDAVVNVSTSQTVIGTSDAAPRPQLPDGSPFQEFFDDFFNHNNNNNGGSGDSTPRRVQSLGSGFVIDPSGIIVTNNHVIEGADEITANFTDGTKRTATLIGYDDKTDLALLKVKADKPLPFVKFGDSTTLRVGDWVMAIGNPFGLGGTVTLGIVSARNRDINAGPYDDFIQTDAAINRGNSGGPLFNLDGQVIGINTAIISPTGGSIGIGFAVPSEVAVGVVDQLRQFGETRRGWLGVHIQEVTDEVAGRLAMDAPHGALVAGVDDGGPAAAAGVENGDVILEFDGKPVSAMHDLPRMVADEPVGKDVPVVVLRDGQKQTLSVTLGRLEAAEKLAAAEPTDQLAQPEAPVVVGPLGLSLADLSPAMRDKFGIKSQVTAGVVVADVASGSVAAEKRLQPGDVIVEISQEPVTTPDDVNKRIADLRKAGRRNAQMVLQNEDGNVRVVNLSLDEQPPPPAPPKPEQ
jgi:serine protease Do